MPRFYCPAPLPSSGSLELPFEAAHHAGRVLRLREGNPVELFDGLGNACRGVLTQVSGKRVLVGELAADSQQRESPLRVLLAQALVSSEKMDFVIQKATELGVTEIQPLDTERSVAKLSEERAAKRLEHWQQIAISACEQCGRNVLPLIYPPLHLLAWLPLQRASLADKYLLSPQGTTTFASQSKPQGRILLLVGAEGGFSQAEGESAVHCGFTPIRLGQRVLRTETAALAAVAALQTLWGDFS